MLVLKKKEIKTNVKMYIIKVIMRNDVSLDR